MKPQRKRRRIFKANAEGMSFLTLSCKGLAFAIIESTITTQETSWKMCTRHGKGLLKKYESKDAEDPVTLK